MAFLVRTRLTLRSSYPGLGALRLGVWQRPSVRWAQCCYSADDQGSPSPHDSADQLRRRQNLSLVHYTLRTDWPAFFERPITFNIYERDMLFEESVSAVGLSCHGLLRYRLLLRALRSVGQVLLKGAKMEVMWCTDDLQAAEVRVRWRVRGQWRGIGRAYELDAMSVYLVGRSGLVTYHRCDKVQRDYFREAAKPAGLFARLFPSPAGYDPLPTCSGQHNTTANL